VPKSNSGSKGNGRNLRVVNRLRAYELYELRGRGDGQTEAELVGVVRSFP